MKLYSLVIVLSILLFLGLCEDNPTEPDNGGENETEVIPKAGEWTATADFGGFDFEINDSHDRVTSITYNFSSWTCGGKTMSGSISVSSEPGWQIADLQFSIEMDLNPDPFTSEPITIEGTFETSSTAAGTWQAKVGSATCSGTWEGQAKN